MLLITNAINNMLLNVWNDISFQANDYYLLIEQFFVDPKYKTVKIMKYSNEKYIEKQKKKRSEPCCPG